MTMRLAGVKVVWWGVMLLSTSGLSPMVFAKKSEEKTPKAAEVKPDEKKAAEGAKPDDGSSFICPAKKPVLADIARSDVYKDTPYKAGETAEYEVRYASALAGTAKIDVRPPYKVTLDDKKSYWHRSFHVDARTGEWYKLIFVAHDQIEAQVRVWDHGITKFYMEQDEGKLFGRRLQQKKWLEFEHDNCKVTERTVRPNKPDKKATFDLSYGAMDTLGVAFWLREKTFKVGEKVRGLVYSSEKNWWLEAEPLAVEKIKVKAGEFEAMKIKLQTYIGKDLQQKGDVYIWIDTKTPQRPLVQIQAEIKLGSVWVELIDFKPGI